MGRAKKLPANKTMDVDEKSFLHKLCLAGECEELCATVSCGLAEKIHPERQILLLIAWFGYFAMGAWW